VVVGVGVGVVDCVVEVGVVDVGVVGTVVVDVVVDVIVVGIGAGNVDDEHDLVRMY
jgi:hypothetical protein